MSRPLALLAGSCLLAAGCAASAEAPRQPTRSIRDPRASFASYYASSRTVGPGARFRPGPRGEQVDRGAVVAGMACKSASPPVAAAHVELFAAGHVVGVPAGIGVAPPLRRAGAYVLAGRCVYPLRTLEPTGLVLLGVGPTRTLGELFELWGQRLGEGVLAGFTAPPGGHVSVYIDGVPWHGDPAGAPLAPRTQVTVEVGPRVPPHSGYVFPSLAHPR